MPNRAAAPIKARPLSSLNHLLFIIPAVLGRYQGDLLEDMNGRRLLGRER